MKKNTSKPLFKLMVARRIVPTLVTLLTLLVFFCLLLSMMVLHTRRTRREHQLDILRQSVNELEVSLAETEYKQRAILTSMTFSQFTYMYDDLSWYRRYELQSELAQRMIELQNSADCVQSVWLHIPSLKKTISDRRTNAEQPSWIDAVSDLSGGRLKDGNMLYTVTCSDPEELGKTIASLTVVYDRERMISRLSANVRGAMEDIILEWGEDLAPLSPDAQKKSGEMVIDGEHFPLRVRCIPYEDAADLFVWQITLLCVGFVLLVVLVEAWGGVKWYKDVYIPVYHLLVNAFDHAEQGDFKYRITTDGYTAFTPIYECYNRMMAKTEAYVENNLKQQILVSRANFKQLQAQISPHFMYNSYYVLYRLIKKGDRESSLRLAEHLGQFYHYITRNAEDEKRLSEEVEHARTYASIQIFRFRDALDIQIDNPPPEIANVYVPRLILQPLLENAFKYAYETEDGCDVMKLRIHFEVRHPYSFDILVENSGSVSDETLNAIRERIADTSESIETTALVNIHRRLQIYFGEHSALKVERSALGGLLVRMCIEDTRRGL